MSLKKGILRGILAVVTVSLSACGTKKDYEMSFADATALLQKQTQTFSDILLQPAGSQEQTLSISTFLKDLEGTDINLDLAVVSQKNIENSESDATITFDANFQAEEMDIAASGTLKMLTNLQHLYLNAEKFWISSSDSGITMLAAMIEGFKGKWIQLDLQNSNEVNALLTQYQTRIQQLHQKYQHLLVEKGYEKYQGKFEQFRGYNAYQVDLNPEKLQELLSDTDFFMKELEQQSALPAIDEETAEAIETIETIDLAQDIEISALQAYLVITHKNKVALVVDSMEIKVKGESLQGEYRFSTEGIWMNFENPNLPEPIHVSILKEKGDTHTVNIDLLDMMKVTGNVEIKARKSEYAMKFNLALTVSNQSLPETLSLPLKGEWKIKEIKPFIFKEPTDTMSLEDILGGFGLPGLGGVLGGWGDYDYDDYYDDDMMDYDVADYDLEDYELTEEDMQQMMELMKAMNG